MLEASRWKNFLWDLTLEVLFRLSLIQLTVFGSKVAFFFYTYLYLNSSSYLSAKDLIHHDSMTLPSFNLVISRCGYQSNSRGAEDALPVRFP